MAKIFPGERITDVWLDACMHLAARSANHFADRNLLLEISNPTLLTQRDLQTIQLVDGRLRASPHGATSINTVAATIFPNSLYQRKRSFPLLINQV